MSNDWGSGEVGKRGRLTVIAAAILVLPHIPTSPLQAQVGHDPSHSPFRDIATRQELTFLAGDFLGNTAKAGVGAQQATSLGIRFRTKLAGPLDLVVRGAYISSQRLVIDPTKPDSIRRSGPVHYGLIATDVGLSLTLTGSKTWHGFAPWIGLGMGVVAPTSTVTDPGGYRAAINFTFTPSIGTSFTITRKLGLQLELRDNTMRYEWPLAYFDPHDANNVKLPPAILPLTERDKQLTHNFTLSAGLSYHFNF